MYYYHRQNTYIHTHTYTQTNKKESTIQWLAMTAFLVVVIDVFSHFLARPSSPLLHFAPIVIVVIALWCCFYCAAQAHKDTRKCWLISRGLVFVFMVHGLWILLRACFFFFLRILLPPLKLFSKHQFKYFLLTQFANDIFSKT